MAELLAQHLEHRRQAGAGVLEQMAAHVEHVALVRNGHASSAQIRGTVDDHDLPALARQESAGREAGRSGADHRDVDPDHTGIQPNGC